MPRRSASEVDPAADMEVWFELKEINFPLAVAVFLSPLRSSFFFLLRARNCQGEVCFGAGVDVDAGNAQILIALVKCWGGGWGFLLINSEHVSLWQVRKLSQTVTMLPRLEQQQREKGQNRKLGLKYFLFSRRLDFLNFWEQPTGSKYLLLLLITSSL